MIHSSDYERLTVGLVGERLSHSHSPLIHGLLGNPYYRLFELPQNRLDDFFCGRNFHALNVTIPYKKDVISYCDSLSTIAKRCNSVNTILNRDGKLHGYNTDFIGFITMLNFYDIDVKGRSCAVLGSGGAGGTAVEALKVIGAKSVVTVSRSGEYNYNNLERIADIEILVNSTPVGLMGRNDDMPVDPTSFKRLEAVVDLIANPYRTELVSRAANLGLKAAGGDCMLFAQAVAAAALFFDRPISLADFGSRYAEYRRHAGNIVLIGMPGSGKNTVGALIAQKLSMKMVDTDELIAQRAGISIPEIFEKHGEEYFRNLETEIVDEVCEERGAVIITGGGVIERSKNRARLRRAGMVFEVIRPLNELSLRGRPVSQRDGVAAIYERRKPLYDDCSDYSIDNKAPQQRCDAIVQKFYDECMNTVVNLGEFAKLV